MTANDKKRQLHLDQKNQAKYFAGHSKVNLNHAHHLRRWSVKGRVHKKTPVQSMNTFRGRRNGK